MVRWFPVAPYLKKYGDFVDKNGFACLLAINCFGEKTLSIDLVMKGKGVNPIASMGGTAKLPTII